MFGSRSFGAPIPSVALACGSMSMSSVGKPASAMHAADARDVALARLGQLDLGEELANESTVRVAEMAEEATALGARDLARRLLSAGDQHFGSGDRDRLGMHRDRLVKAVGIGRELDEHDRVAHRGRLAGERACRQLRDIVAEHDIIATQEIAGIDRALPLYLDRDSAVAAIGAPGLSRNGDRAG